MTRSAVVVPPQWCRVEGSNLTSPWRPFYRRHGVPAPNTTLVGMVGRPYGPRPPSLWWPDAPTRDAARHHKYIIKARLLKFSGHDRRVARPIRKFRHIYAVLTATGDKFGTSGGS